MLVEVFCSVMTNVKTRAEARRLFLLAERESGGQGQAVSERVARAFRFVWQSAAVCVATLFKTGAVVG